MRNGTTATPKLVNVDEMFSCCEEILYNAENGGRSSVLKKAHI
jgi:hypothetical protein